MERLQKILSQAGVASRRAAEEFIRQGRVTVNGTTVRELGTKADAAADDIRVDHVAGNADREDVPQSLVEDQLRGRPGGGRVSM